MRLLVALSLLSLASCTCQNGINSASGDLRVTPAVLHFPDTFVGGTASLPLEIQNEGFTDQEASVHVGAPYFLASDAIHVFGGSSVALDVRFSPDLPAPFVATLVLTTTDQQMISVVLDGQGVAQPTCANELACHASQFSLDAGACVVSTLPNLTGCGQMSTCLSQAVCIDGECLGSTVPCDDSDACTRDACDVAAGCLHFDISAKCPVGNDPCRVPVCDPKTGCGYVDAPDGTSCGDSDCTTAHVCIVGVCKVEPVPDGFVCAPGSPCQPADRRHNQVCDQPAKTMLKPVWTYSSVPAWYQGQPIGGVSPLVDDQGNIYTSHGTGTAGILSLTALGLLRYVNPRRVRPDAA